jgi:hypothetical protein
MVPSEELRMVKGREFPQGTPSAPLTVPETD